MSTAIILCQVILIDVVKSSAGSIRRRRDRAGRWFTMAALSSGRSTASGGRGTGFTLTPDMVGPDNPPYYLVKRTMMNLRQTSLDMAPGGATRMPLAVQTATAEERGVTPSTAGQYDGGGPNPTPGSLQLEGIREERSGISLRRQIMTGT